MSRVFLRNSSSGYVDPKGGVVFDLQRALARAGHSPGKIDGDFGNGTETALRGYQKDKGLPETGGVDLATWSRLTGTAALPAIYRRCLAVTASFEGHGYTLAVGNFDGALLTWGIIGFTLDSGTLIKVMKRIDTLDPDAIGDSFGGLETEWRDVMAASKTKQRSWANSVSQGPKKYDLRADWKDAFARLGRTDVGQQAQDDVARDPYWKNALKIADEFDLRGELGLALSFDIAVQNGSVDKSDRKHLADLLKQSGPVTGQKFREVLAEAMARGSKPEYYGDVLSRKMTLAVGRGQVHKGNYQLRDWGLEDVPTVADAEDAVATAMALPDSVGWSTAGDVAAILTPAMPASGDDEADFVAFITSLGLRHFKPYEFLVKGGAHSNPQSPAFGLNTNPPRALWPNIAPTARVLDVLRGRLAAPIRPTSVYRSPAYNTAIGGATSSLHMRFNAVDFVAQGNSGPTEWASTLRGMRSEGLFAGGIGTYPGFVHVDTRGENADWNG